MISFDQIDLEQIVEEVLAGREIDRQTAAAILACPDDRLDDLLGATRRVREAAFGRRVKICMLRNAQSGICPEDCGYCSQSRVSKADIPVYKMQPIAALVEGARIAADSGARRYCMVCSMRGPAQSDVEHLGEACDRIRGEFPELELCLSIGLLGREHADELKERGRRMDQPQSQHQPPLLSGDLHHAYLRRSRAHDRKRARRRTVGTCSGGIIGMGETDDDIIDLAFATRRLKIDSVPVNFLHRSRALRSSARNALTPEKCLKAACLFRLLNPKSEVRAAGGRELNLGERQGDLFNAVNSIFVNGYLTTAGWNHARTREMIERAGFEPESGA